MARKSELLNTTIIGAFFFFLVLYIFFNTFTLDRIENGDPEFSREISVGLAGNSAVKVYMYDLPWKFTYGVIEQHAVARGGGDPVGDAAALKYPGHQHMAEWYLFADLLRPDSERIGSPVLRVSDPEAADLFFVPFFSSLSLVVYSPRVVAGGGSAYSDEEVQEEVLDWVEKQVYWKRNNGVDHVFIAQDPNALSKVVDRIKNAMLIVSDFGRLRPDQGSLVKDIVVPYSHRIRFYDGEIGVENRKTLLFFMGNRYRKQSAAAVKPKFLLSRLKKISTEKIMEYQKELLKVRRYFDYDHPNGTVNEIWRQVSHKLPLVKLMINRDKRLVKRGRNEGDCFCRCSNQTGSITVF